MRGLLLKDFYMMIKYCKMFLLFAVVFFGAAIVEPDNLFFLAYPVILAGMIPVNLLAYDEREKWDLYSAVLPYTRTQLVSVKYLIGLIIDLILFVLAMAVFTIQGVTDHTLMMSGNLELCALIFSLGLLSPMVVLPFSFKWGTEKGRIAYIISIAVVCGVILSMTSGGIIAPDLFQMKIPAFVLMAVMAALYTISWRLSVSFYQKKEL